ncbi:DUF3489 domain-containing protein [Roseicella aerolata]|uniref:DUF3489 domain-containing protein n=1 Tax=Roseicella aerolata TaxID=2883479 RepID=A0A9X1IIF4_9PROT|nr:DUF3489 domain-containing protein [Roseicella aerolata]MCB4825229.1 DUF3489 domain-containing protein [Roseicella aerolata]
MMKLTDTQRAILTAAAQHPEHLALPPERLPAAARQTAAKALLKHDLVIAVDRPAYGAVALWMVEGDAVLLKVTDEGLRAIGHEPAAPEAGRAPLGGEDTALRGEDAPAPEPAQDAPTAADEADPEEDDRPRHEQLGIDEARVYGPAEDWQQSVDDVALLDQALAERTPRGLKAAAQRVLAAWDDEANQRYDLTDAIGALRTALAGKPARPAREPGAPRKPREGTKQEQVLAMLRRSEGATVAQIAEATGWAPHTVRGFFAGLKKRQGIAFEVLERVRQVGPNKEGARGSYTVYKIAD